MKQTFHFGRRSIQTDLGLILILILLGCTSFFALYNSFNLIKDGTGMNYLIRQIFWYAIGFTVMFLISKMNRKVLFSYMGLFYKILMGFLLYLFASRMLYVISSRVFGVGISLPFAPWINGAFSWISLSIASFQPSEFIKIVLIVMVSMELNKFYDKYPNPTPKEEGRLALRLARFVLPPLILIFIQPDTGVCIIIVFTLLVLLMCSGMRKQYVWAVVGAVLFVFAAFFYLYFRHQDVLASVVSAYRLQRIEAWLDPESYILGSSNQLYTALLSLGSAGLSGYGLQANIIAIPEAHTDFIFAAFGQCFGFVGTVFILAVCILLDLYLCRIAYNTKNRTDRLITIGVVAMLFYQQMQNLGMIVGLVPITGITLPLISYGGSSTVSYFIAFGIILNGSPLSKKKINVLKKKAEAQ